MKKKSVVISLLMGATLLFSACSATVSTQLSENWSTNGTYNPDFYEECVYDVRYSNEKATTNVYELKNFGGSYAVKVQAGQSLSVNGTTQGNLFRLDSTLKTRGTYARKGGDDVYSYDFGEITSTVYFRRLGEGFNMQPVRSETNYFVCAPDTNSLNAVELFIAKYSVTIEYNADCSSATYAKRDRSSEIQVEIPEAVKNSVRVKAANDETATLTKLQKNYSYFDNAQAFFIGRGITFAQNANETIQTIVPNNPAKLKAQFSCKSVSKRNYSFTADGEQKTGEIASAEVSYYLSEGNRSGGAYTLYYAAKSDGITNPNRNLLLQIEEPLSFGTGTMVYTLQSTVHTKPQA